MKKLLFFLVFPVLGYGQIQIGQDIDGEASQDLSGVSVSSSSDGNVVAIGAIFNSGNGEGSGHVRVYDNMNDSWIQIGQDIDGEGLASESGRSVSLSSDGSVVAIGARGGPDTFGQVSVYENQGGNWIQIGQDIYGENEGDNLGASVSLSGDGAIIAIGAPGSDSNGAFSGQVSVYENQGGNWILIGQNINGDGDDKLGNSISLSNDGSIVAIGALSNNTNGVFSGQVRVFLNQNGSWTQIGNNINGQTAQELLGSSVSLSSDGSILAIGARNTDFNGDTSGRVRVYENQGGDWLQLGDDINGEAVNDFSGASVSLSSDGTILVIGASGNDGNGENSGHVRIYRNQEENWLQIGMDIDGEAEDDFSGRSVSLSNDGKVLAISAPGNDGNGDSSGHVRVYDLSDLLSTNEVIPSTFTIYPNPASTSVQIELNKNNPLQKVIIYNSLAQEVLQSKSSTIDTESLSSGIYIVEVTTAAGKGVQKLIIE